MTDKFFQEEAIANAKAYHFDATKNDPRFDTAHVLGRFEGDWQTEVDMLIERSKSFTFKTRGSVQGVVYDPPLGHDNHAQGPHVVEEQEFFDAVGYGKHYDSYEIVNKAVPDTPILQKMIDAFGFDTPTQSTVHIQKTGQVFPWHLDIFQNRSQYAGCDKSKIMRVHILLTDWTPGHWYGYGNYTYTGWKAGEFHTFDLDNVPHYTANAAYTPRVSLMITGMRTEKTEQFLWEALSNKTIKV
jgi:hypothetical protein